MIAFDLLSQPIKKFIRDSRWEELRPIQTAAISKILSTENNYILVSKTASGKTEAAFLPILSQVNFRDRGVKVLYISPLIALINDQFNRIEQLCKYLDVTVTKWHGEASTTAKEKLIRDPEGIVLITPESLEAMFVNKTHNIKHLFSDLRFVVIDEIHSFLGSDRGIQLQSILSRLQAVNRKSFRIVGLSATMSEENQFKEVKEFTGDIENTKILIDRAQNEMKVSFRYYESGIENLSLDLLKDLYIETKDNKALIFPNSRGRTEEIAVKLKQIAERVNGHANYFSHHSSVNKDVREFVEYFAKNNTNQNFSIVCTSTLELGIDIGSVDEVVQVDSTNSISSLIQRVGRSGRKDGQISQLFLYATNPWSLLQSIACWLLYNEGFIEPTFVNAKPYDILLHQIMSIIKGRNGLAIDELIDQITKNHAFRHIEKPEIEEIIQHMIETDLLEKLRQEVILGIAGEKIVNGRDFYSVFITEQNFSVVNEGNVIGDVPYSTELSLEKNMFLAASVWKIKSIDMSSKRIDVIPAKDGYQPTYHGSGMTVHPRVKEKMLEILYADDKYEFLNKESQEILTDLRNDFSVFKLIDLSIERPLYVDERYILLYTFTGSRINHTLKYLLEFSGLTNSLDDPKSEIYMEVSKEMFNTIWSSLPTTLSNIDNYLSKLLEKQDYLLNFSKWGYLLPLKYKVNLFRDKYFDVPGTVKYLEKVKLVENFEVFPKLRGLE